jgi:hypothetical protein
VYIDFESSDYVCKGRAATEAFRRRVVPCTPSSEQSGDYNATRRLATSRCFPKRACAANDLLLLPSSLRAKYKSSMTKTREMNGAVKDYSGKERNEKKKITTTVINYSNA